MENGCDLRPFHNVERNHPCEGESGASLEKAIEKTGNDLATVAVSYSLALLGR
jgi:hypothetical protein